MSMIVPNLLIALIDLISIIVLVMVLWGPWLLLPVFVLPMGRLLIILQLEGAIFLDATQELVVELLSSRENGG